MKCSDALAESGGRGIENIITALKSISRNNYCTKLKKEFSINYCNLHYYKINYLFHQSDTYKKYS